MAEDLARALGAKGTNTITIAGKECIVRPLGLQELTEVERDCVNRYKRRVLETFAQNMDLLPQGRGQFLLERKVEEVSKWDSSNLPPKIAHNPQKIELNDTLKKWLQDNFSIDEKMDDDKYRAIVATVLDKEELSEVEYEQMIGKPSPKTKVSYVNWWITGDYEGMISFVWVCFRTQGITREQVVDSLRDNLSLLVELTREIERLSAPQPGNG